MPPDFEDDALEPAEFILEHPGLLLETAPSDSPSPGRRSARLPSPSEGPQDRHADLRVWVPPSRATPAIPPRPACSIGLVSSVALRPENWQFQERDAKDQAIAASHMTSGSAGLSRSAVRSPAVARADAVGSGLISARTIPENASPAALKRPMLANRAAGLASRKGRASLRLRIHSSTHRDYCIIEFAPPGMQADDGRQFDR